MFLIDLLFILAIDLVIFKCFHLSVPQLQACCSLIVQASISVSVLSGCAHRCGVVVF